MKRLGVLGILALVLAVGTPRTAAAQWGFFEWLASLDPGQAHIVNEHLDFKCFGGATTGQGLPGGVLVLTPHQSKFGATDAVEGRTATGCLNPENARFLLGADFNLGWAGIQNTTPRQHIGLTAEVGTIERNFGGKMQVGFGVGAARFWQRSSSTDPGFGLTSPVAAVEIGVKPGVIAHRHDAGAPVQSARSAFMRNVEVRFSLYEIWNGSKRANPTTGPAFKSRDLMPMISVRIGFISVFGLKL